MATRSVIGTIHDPTGQPWPDFDITFTVDPSAYTVNAHYPYESVTATTDASGAFAIDLEVGLAYTVTLTTALVTSGSATRYPAGTQFEIVVPSGSTPISLAAIRADPVEPDDPDILDFTANHLSDTSNPHSTTAAQVGAYTTAEVDTALAGKADTAHTHPVADIDATGTADGTTYLRGDGTWSTPAGGGGGGTWGSITGTLADQTDLQSALDGKSATTHDHDGDYAALAHTHDDRYYTETEVDTALTGKADTGHGHTASDVSDFDAEVGNHPDVTANTAARHAHANQATLDATTASFTTDDETKLDGIEIGADVTDAANVEAAGAVMDTGDQIVAGVKTFSASPIVPAPTTDLQAATKKYVDDNAGGGGGARPGWTSGSSVLSTRSHGSGGSVLSQSQGGGSLVVTWFAMPENLSTIDFVRVNVTTASASGAGRIGLFTPSGSPSALTLDLVRDCGVVSTATTGEKTISGLAQAVTPGANYFWGIVIDETATFTSHQPSSGLGIASMTGVPHAGAFIATSYGPLAASYSGGTAYERSILFGFG